MADLELVKKLREETGISLGDCKKALDESGNDMEKAKEYLKKRGQAVAQKKGDREAGCGIIDTYVHSNKRVGVMLEIACETDFVAMGEDFNTLAHEVCLQIASMRPQYVKEEEVPEEKMAKEICLLSQPWVKDNTKNIQALINEYIAKTGENIIVRRFVMYEF